VCQNNIFTTLELSKFNTGNFSIDIYIQAIDDNKNTTFNKLIKNVFNFTVNNNYDDMLGLYNGPFITTLKWEDCDE